MIQANRLIFPRPQAPTAKVEQAIAHNLIVIPKPPNNSTPSSHLPQNMHLAPPPSTISTSRTMASQSVRQPLAIRPQNTIKYPNTACHNPSLSPKKVPESDPRRPQRAAGEKRSEYKVVKIRMEQEAMPHSLRVKMHKIRHKVKSELCIGEEKEQREQLEVQTVRLLSKKARSKGLAQSLWDHSYKESKEGVPCLYYQSLAHPSKLMVYFHGNGEDLTGCCTFLRRLCHSTGVSVLAMEYPGYSVYRGQPCSNSIEEDARTVIQFLTGPIGYETSDIMVLGRSIGSGPALHLASLYSLGGLVLLSPFLSLCEVASDLYGALVASLLQQRFDNKQRAQCVNCASLLVHGTSDQLISEKHSAKLSQYFRGYSTTKLVSNMTHSSFDHQQFYAFVRDFQLKTEYLP